ncbi:MAG: hypothetical protein KAI43_12770 [Candidatus Aureabacteria bacterium]|nr:hypothetical protein [Candidatus Auribacterota bacterium]
MKTFSIFLLCFIFVSVCFAENIIPKQNRVILKEKTEFIPYEEIWIPTEEETNIALTSIVALLKDKESHKDMPDYNKRNIENIYNNLSSFRVQFVGIINKGNKRILCNFMHNHLDHPDWKKDYITVFNGGWSYWSVEVDIITGKCINLYIHGEA